MALSTAMARSMTPTCGQAPWAVANGLGPPSVLCWTGGGEPDPTLWRRHRRWGVFLGRDGTGARACPTPSSVRSFASVPPWGGGRSRNFSWGSSTAVETPAPCRGLGGGRGGHLTRGPGSPDEHFIGEFPGSQSPEKWSDSKSAIFFRTFLPGFSWVQTEGGGQRTPPVWSLLGTIS